MGKMKVFCAFGTRPEAIKLFPLVHRLEKSSSCKPFVLTSGQHREMLEQVLSLSGVEPDQRLDVMRPGQSLDELTARLLTGIAKSLREQRPDVVVVQGDTLTAMCGALAAYLERIPVAHVEAGLRSGDIYHPWPEEVSRKTIGTFASLHFAPTEAAARALRNENVPEGNIYVTGNTVIDALNWVTNKLSVEPNLADRIHPLESRAAGRRIIAMTTHRRENLGEGMTNIAMAAASLAQRSDVFLIFPMHLNPAVREIMEPHLSGRENVALIEPLDYVNFARLLQISDLILTDSGGVQEEAPALGKPVLVMRETTERPEGVAAGTAKLVGTVADKIVSGAETLLDDDDAYASMATAHNPFGDGTSSDQIVSILESVSMDYR